MCPMGQIKESVALETKTDWGLPFKLAISNDARFVAGVLDDGSIKVLDIEMKKEEVFEGIPYVKGFCWSWDQKGLIISSSEWGGKNRQIFWLDVNDKNIRILARGYGARVTGIDEIAFWRNSMCYKMNVRTGVERKFFIPKSSYGRGEWDLSGRFLVVSRSAATYVPVRLIAKAKIWDTQEERWYYLPNITGGIYGTKHARTYWVRNN